MPFPPLSPIAFELGPLVVRWYALGYLAGVFGGAWYATTLLRREHLWAGNRPPFPSPAIWDFAFWAIVGIVLGGRLGYVLFYNLPWYAANPGEIIALWDGGMSYHGGMAGLMVAMAIFTRRHGGSILQSFDLLGAIATIGIFLVRLTNFINAEL
ncbi:MAG TPA: prolipoprotein diacylglyceryl transferase, partial [Devosia sp.]|nr:prolipoprotein diacylglyceryl transferase [Devosia sp.]